jgi:hypothetical protein
MYGIPFAVQTQSGRPFVQDLADMIVRGLRSQGVQAQAVNLSPFKSRDETLATLQAQSSPRLLLFEITEWYGDTYVTTTLHYDLSLTVLDAQGRELGKGTAKGEDDIGGRQRPERKTVPIATTDIIQGLLSSRDVVAALSMDAQPKGGRKCTVEQILKMRESGLLEEQIKAACGEG